ncbi:uncharacterized protein TM35_000023970 [Trypanosoma theileri]|uniref:Transmembrane protein 222 n=1 Tax=Trypanosoma theileri TaxID=67003 RepID=A0A1X0P8A2_9TRYP|nr:uncharacterized protein TM35_000023970 [Trypanosoma theileri]ORC93071.1 hypothetical protein TM35_000023970 [Trypanosoma theileri]
MLKRKAMEEMQSSTTLPLPPKIDPLNEHYPFCIVWTPIPLLSWILPFIGHVGICDSAGRIHDFEGPYNIGIDHMLFGNPVKYWDISKTFVPSFYHSMLDPHSQEFADLCHKEVEEYDAAIGRVTKHFRRTQMYNFFTNNCHSFVASTMKDHPLSTGSWNMFRVAWGLAIHGRYVSTARFFKAHLPFIILVTIIVLICVFVPRS